MIKLKVKIKKEDKSYSQIEYLADTYSVCKNNPDFIVLIENIIKESRIEDPDTVVAIATMDL